MMIERIGKAAMLEQLAEEAAELAKEAIKAARIERGENPTPVTAEEAAENMAEEYTDVVQCAMEIGLMPDFDQMREKSARFLNRWEKSGKGPV